MGLFKRLNEVGRHHADRDPRPAPRGALRARREIVLADGGAGSSGRRTPVLQAGMSLASAWLARHCTRCLGALGTPGAQCRWQLLLTVIVIGIALALPRGLWRAGAQRAAAPPATWPAPWIFRSTWSPTSPLDKARQLADEPRASARASPRVTLMTAAEAAAAEFREDPGFAAPRSSAGRNPLPHLLVVRPPRSHASAAARGAAPLISRLARGRPGAGRQRLGASASTRSSDPAAHAAGGRRAAGRGGRYRRGRQHHPAGHPEPVARRSR